MTDGKDLCESSGAGHSTCYHSTCTWAQTMEISERRTPPQAQAFNKAGFPGLQDPVGALASQAAALDHLCTRAPTSQPFIASGSRKPWVKVWNVNVSCSPGPTTRPYSMSLETQAEGTWWLETPQC